jgi:hypothetical protein
MVHAREQILQDNLQRIRDFTQPSPVMASVLSQIKNVQRSHELARSMGFVFPEEKPKEKSR